MKKNLIGAIMLVAVLAFVGCGNRNQKAQTENQSEVPAPNQMLIIVDPQIDFTTGSLATAKGPEAMERLAKAVDAGVLKKYSWVVVTQDAHPANHCSFTEQGGIFPPHCVQGTEGMDVYPNLQKALEKANPEHLVYLQKGNLPEKEEFSIFQNDKSCDKLRDIIVKQHFDGIDICGIATDYCVYETARDLIKIFPNQKIRIVSNCLAAVDDNDTKLADMMAEHGIQSIEY